MNLPSDLALSGGPAASTIPAGRAPTRVQAHGVRPARCVDYATSPIPEHEGRYAMITLDRPDQLNAITAELIAELDEALSAVESDVDVRVVFITGRGRSFSAGGDLNKYIELQQDPLRFPRFVEALHKTFARIRTIRAPVVALVNGVTAAGGLELLLSCDISIAAESARIGDGHLNFGQMGGGGVLTMLPRMIGLPLAMELVITGKFVPAETAAEWGLVGRVVPDADLLGAGIALAQEIATKSALGVANAKSVMNTIWSEALSTSAGMRIERDQNSLYCLTSHDAPEGLQAFNQKRPPRFQGR
jgi:enoyl-CoA hydratase/carnithine racemase